MGKGACIKRMVAVRNYSANTMKEKNKQRGKRGDGQGYGIFRAKVRNLKIFSGLAHSVLISLGHCQLHFWLCQPRACKYDNYRKAP